MSPINSEYWRGIEARENSSAFLAALRERFPEFAHLPSDALDRRRFLRLLGASLALAGVTSAGCRRWPVEEVRPHAAQPEDLLPGVPQYYATSFELDGVATGILAKSYDGRPITIEGNSGHPFSLGATDALMQASILEMYDPERSRRYLQRVRAKSDASGLAASEVERTQGDFQRFAAGHFRALREKKGAGLAILLPPNSSPSVERLKRELETAMPQARWFTYQPLHHDFEYAGSRLAFNRNLRPQFAFDKAQVIAAFDADLLGTHPAKLRMARDWAAGRKSVSQGRMNRLYVVESGYSITGSVADLRLAISPSGVAQSLGYLAARLGLIDVTPDGLTPKQQEWLDALVADLSAARGASIVAAGPAQSAEVHQLVFAINQALGNFGFTLQFTDEPLAGAVGNLQSIEQLSNLLQGDVIQTLVLFGGNPVYDAPADTTLNLVSTTERPLTTIHLSSYENETSAQCSWTIPAAHFLECWGDGRAWDGTCSIQQPLILPMFEGLSAIELLSLMLGGPAKGQSLVRGTFDRMFPSAGKKGWEIALHDGFVSESKLPLVSPPGVNLNRGVKLPSATGLEARFTPDNKVFDGRFANNAWLQELPDPLTKLTWDNAALLSIADAEQLGFKHGDMVRIVAGESSRPVEIAVYILPGHAEGCITLPLGYGRQAGGSIGVGVGFSVWPLRTTVSSYHRANLQISGTGKNYQLATTQLHHLLPSIADFALKYRLGEKGKPGLIVHETTLSEYLQDHHAPHGNTHAIHPAPLFDQPHSFDTPHRWAMTIDLNACTGCSGCVVACQAENNIPVVGKSQVANSREMHWLRIDRYFKGSLDDPDVVHVPITCAHCENAPCEQVCPVAATVHDTEGINGMVYNRCIGTRYCANNCPYKVRRFNYLEYHATHPRNPARPWLGVPDQQLSNEVSPLVQLMHNPEVSVRMRGVMEKCTYCVQRIAAARINAKNDFVSGRRASSLLGDGEVQTACQASCPTQAISFGDLNDPQSTVSKERQNHRHYEILEELNLGARTTHLAKIRNR
jgi:MoCo/4Fe-4S cofactor protein with predicted Tat translocation signal